MGGRSNRKRGAEEQQGESDQYPQTYAKQRAEDLGDTLDHLNRGSSETGPSVAPPKSVGGAATGSVERGDEEAARASKEVKGTGAAETTDRGSNVGRGSDDGVIAAAEDIVGGIGAVTGPLDTPTGPNEDDGPGSNPELKERTRAPKQGLCVWCDGDVHGVQGHQRPDGGCVWCACSWRRDQR